MLAYDGGHVVTTNTEVLTGTRFTRHDAALAAAVGTQAGKCSIRDGKDMRRKHVMCNHTTVLTHHLQYNVHFWLKPTMMSSKTVFKTMCTVKFLCHSSDSFY